MKNRAIIFLAAFIAAASLAGCGKGDGDKDYGYAYVLMPQAQRVEGYYAVPGGSEERTRNFEVAGDKVNVYLGVLRSGKLDNGAFSVNVATNSSAAQDFIYDNGGVPEEMPAAMYTLPTTVSVPGNSNQASFYLELSASQLQQPQYDGKRLVLCVELQNPTAYKLSRESARTTVVVDVNALREFL